jgi:hypothetical protein
MATQITLAKPAWIPMSEREWDALSETHKKTLIAKGKSSPDLPAASVAPPHPPPTEIHSQKAKALLERIAQGKEHTYALQQLWISLELCECAPDARQFMVWFYKHEFETVADAFSETAIWLSKLRGAENPTAADKKTHEDKVKYASAVMNGIVKATNETTLNRSFGDGTELPADWDTLDGSEKRKLIAMHKGEVQQ